MQMLRATLLCSFSTLLLDQLFRLHLCHPVPCQKCTWNLSRLLFECDSSLAIRRLIWTGFVSGRAQCIYEYSRASLIWVICYMDRIFEDELGEGSHFCLDLILRTCLGPLGESERVEAGIRVLCSVSLRPDLLVGQLHGGLRPVRVPAGVSAAQLRPVQRGLLRLPPVPPLRLPRQRHARTGLPGERRTVPLQALLRGQELRPLLPRLLRIPGLQT